MVFAVVVLLALALAFGTYLGLERLGRRGVGPAAFRALAWGALGLLLLNLSCPRSSAGVRPLVLLDGSLSLAAAGGRWSEARAAASSLGEVRVVAGRVGAPDSLPSGGNSRVAGAVEAAAASRRPLWLVTDGEIDDLSDLPRDVLAQTGIKTFPRTPRPDLAIVRVEGPDRVTTGDSLRLEVDIAGYGVADRKRVDVEAAEGSRVWLHTTASLAGGTGRAVLSGLIPEVAAGAHLLEVRLKGAADGDPRTDVRLHLLTVTATPGLVVIGAPGSWDSKFFFAALSEVASLPVRGYLSAEPGKWRRMGDLRPVPEPEVEQAVGRADLVVIFGDRPEWAARSRARARWLWTATSRTGNVTTGDWYLSSPAASPVAGAFVGLPVDSFPPAAALSPLVAGSSDWVGLTAQLSRRGPEHPAVIGRDSAGRREVVVAAGGLWRWAFRGGSSEQAYRSWVAAATSWLLAAPDSSVGKARPRRAVVQQGRPIVFERTRPDSVPLGITLESSGAARQDTLRFDGAGRAELFLPPGQYRYRLEGGGNGVVAVEQFTDEWLPHPVVTHDQSAGPASSPDRAPLRDRLWLFGLAVVGLAGEWYWRRRLGLR